MDGRRLGYESELPTRCSNGRSNFREDQRWLVTSHAPEWAMCTRGVTLDTQLRGEQNATVDALTAGVWWYVVLVDPLRVLWH